MNDPSSRRDWIKKTLGAATVMVGTPALAQMCRLTPRQGEGPYYPEADLNRDSNLVEFRPGLRPEGFLIYLSGVVRGPDCQPIKDAVVEIWQASARGRYNHTQDPNTDIPLDPNFQYWGRGRTTEKGAYLFKTIIPGHYEVGGGRFRPPHIHVKVHARGFYSLTSQIYFDPRSYDDPKLASVVAKLNAAENVPESLMVLYRPSSRRIEVGAKLGRFNFTLRPN